MPGVGKSLIIKAIMTSLASSGSGVNYFVVKCSNICSRYFGDSERFVENLFKKAKEKSPCLLIFDEIDALFKERYVSKKLHPIAVFENHQKGSFYNIASKASFKKRNMFCDNAFLFILSL